VSARDRTVIGILALVAAIAGGWLLVIQPKRGELSSLQGQVSTAQSQLSAAESQVAAGESARAQFGTNYTSLVKLGEAVPTDDNLPSLIFQLQAAATASRVDFRGLSLASGGGGSTAGGALPPGVTQGSSGFPSEPFSFTFRGSFFNLADFFARLERFVTVTQGGISVRGRLLTLDGISLGPGAGGFPTIDATVSATAYLLPTTQGLLAGATPSGPAGAGATQQASTGTSTPAPTPSTGASSSGVSTPPAAVVTGGQP
jgi:Type II secretion system (T2SS), protein M